MSGSGNTFSATVDGFTNGQTISYACKFAFAGGLAVTKYFSYQVGDDCALSFDEVIIPNKVIVYPNPADKEVYVSVSQGTIDKLALFTISGKKIKETNATENRIELDDVTTGLYLIKVYQGNKHSFHRLMVQ